MSHYFDPIPDTLEELNRKFRDLAKIYDILVLITSSFIH